ncbi:trypsin-like [Hyalella azteca]|uniref:Trypsin-like n=1 Tax=Hyalella azteca TaxID=294128 RepID=A0A979FT68_HYAAZ|nr:trypsin-like [Hyalella azteca]
MLLVANLQPYRCVHLRPAALQVRTPAALQVRTPAALQVRYRCVHLQPYRCVHLLPYRCVHLQPYRCVHLQPYRVACEQRFVSGAEGGLVALECQTLALRVSCAFESLRVTTADTDNTYCRDDKMMAVNGPEVNVTFTRSVSGVNGGYVCFVTSNVTQYECPTCGQIDVSQTAKLTNNINASIVEEQHPWTVYVRVYTNSTVYACGGTLITQNLVLSAAHCLHGIRVTKVRVWLGLLDRTKPEPGSLYQDSYTYHVHESYDPTTFVNDISVVVLPSSVVFTTRIQPACLPPADRQLDDVTVVATGWGLTSWGARCPPPSTGWGLTSWGGTLSPTMQQVALQVWTNAACTAAWQDHFNDFSFSVSYGQLCALGSGADTCSGDSGGPLVLNVIVGITSFGYECATPDVPGVYTRVQSYVPWVQQYIVPGACAV